jgi:EAL domain-containing protein (putative c-di-GMP-specific phosphodiesterase class I)
VIVRGVVDMARSLGMVVVAEGVESESQLETLVREGCNWYQGYLCSPPLALGDLPPFVENWQRARAA